MTKQESIKYISSLINNPSTITEGDQSSIALFRQRFPYFVPMRYLMALEAHKKTAWSPAMLSAMQPYMGNWLVFCKFLEDGAGAVPADYVYEQAEETQPVTTDELNENSEHEEVYSEAVQEEEIAIPEEEEETTETITETPAWAENEEQTETVTYDEPVASDITIDETQAETDIALEMSEIEETPGEEPVFADAPAYEAEIPAEKVAEKEIQESLIAPIHTHDYFLHQGERVSEDIPDEIDELKYQPEGDDDEEKSLMVMMSFSEWLLHFKNGTEKQQEEVKDRKALRTMWQKEKLAAAMEEENEEIPENVFEMAVNSITQEDGLISETLAEVYIKQGKYDKAIDTYRKLSLRNPQKNVYFARKIDEVLKDKQS